MLFRSSGEFKPGGSEAQKLSAITFAPGALGLLRVATARRSASVSGMELLAAAIIMMRRRSTLLVAGQYVRTEAATLTR